MSQPFVRQTYYIIIIIVLNVTFSNISAILWRPVLVVEEAGVSGENHRNRSWALFVIYKAVLVIGLYELLGNPTT